MRISQYIVFILLVGFFSKSHFATIDDLFVPEDGENTCLFEDFHDDLSNEQAFLLVMSPLTIKKSICLKEMNQTTIEGCLYIETPPPENL